MVNDLIQKATDALREQKFTEHTIRMSYLNYWKPFEAKYAGCALSKELAASYAAEKYKVDIMIKDVDSLNKKQRRVRHAFQVLLDFREKGYITSSSMTCKRIRQPLSAADHKTLMEYLEYRRGEGDAESTLDNKRRIIHRYLLEVPIKASNKNAILSYLARLSAGLSNSSMKTKLIALKGFLSYCTQEGILNGDYNRLFPKFKDYCGLYVPSAYTPLEIQELTHYINNLETPNKKRNHAMTMLMATYGFRARDILNMELSDIDWGRASITARLSKTENEITFMLTPVAGNSLIDYLLEERPISPCQRIFLKRDGQPIGTTSTISTTVSVAFINSGIKVGGRRHGSHSLRHSLATAMLNNGSGIFEISRVLGHSLVDSSRTYTKVDVENLQLCELEVPCHE
jgi:site-specific recombinase XerD